MVRAIGSAHLNNKRRDIADPKYAGDIGDASYLAVSHTNPYGATRI
jgi:hypothetical protein